MNNLATLLQLMRARGLGNQADQGVPMPPPTGPTPGRLGNPMMWPLPQRPPQAPIQRPQLFSTATPGDPRLNMNFRQEPVRRPGF
jgi:hypothetical protein